MKRSLSLNRVALGALACAGLVGCFAVLDLDGYETVGAFDASPIPTSPPTIVEPFSIRVAQSNVAAITGEPTPVVVEVVRQLPFDSPITFGLSGAHDIVLSSASTTTEAGSGSIGIVAGGVHGVQSVTLTATTAAYPSFTAHAPLSVQVRGRPGALDTSFGENGVFTGSFPGAAFDAVVVEGGRILISGSEWSDGGEPTGAWSLFALSADGKLDASFGTGGRATITPGHPGGIDEEGANTMAVLADSGDLAVLGAAFGGTVGLLRRVRRDASVDLSFGDGGEIVSDPPCTTVLGEGEDILVAQSYPPALVRFLPNGAPDPSFADGGVASAPDQSMEITGAVRLPDGRVAVLGFANGAFAFFTVDGAGNVGPLLSSTADAFDVPKQRQIRISDGRIVFLGGTGIRNGGSSAPDKSLAIASVLVDGGADLAFGDAGAIASVDYPGAVVLVDGGVVHATTAYDVDDARIVGYTRKGDIAWVHALDGFLSGAVPRAVLSLGDRILVVGSRPLGTTRPFAMRIWL